MAFIYFSGENVWNLDILEYGISSNAELWGVLQPYEHLICGRNAFGNFSKNFYLTSFPFKSSILQRSVSSYSNNYIVIFLCSILPIIASKI